MTVSIDNPLPCPWPGADQKGTAFICWHCQGTGELPHFRHIADGVCFTCKGRGWQYSPNAAKGRGPRKAWKKIDGKLVAV